MNSPAVLYVRTDLGGHDIHGDGTCQRPFRTQARAISEDPAALICVDDVYSNMVAKNLTELGEEIGPVDFAKVDRAILVFGACTVGFVVAAIVHSPLAAIFTALVLVLGVLGIEQILDKGLGR